MEGLPRQFLSSLRILFDILDENRTGYVSLCDIETRWSDDGVRGLPPGVVDGLRKVTPPNGLLTFDRFVSGLKLVLTKRKGNDENNRDGRKAHHLSKEVRNTFENQKERIPYKLEDAANRPNRLTLDGRQTTTTKSPNGPSPTESTGSNSNRQHDRRSYDSSNQSRKSSQFQSSSTIGGPVKAREVTSYNAFAVKPDVNTYSTNHNLR